MAAEIYVDQAGETESNMKNKKNHSAVYYLLRIVINAVLSVLIFVAGEAIDSAIFSNPAPDVHGHGVPIFSAVCFIAALLFFVISTIVCIVKAIRAGKNREQY